MNKENSFLKPLETMREVETPPFLLTRIYQRIESRETSHFSPKLVWGLAISFCLLLIINNWTNKETKHENNLVENLQLSTNNDIYK